MKLPGSGFLRERSAVRAFEGQDAAFRDLVFYSEGSGDWPHLGPVVERLVEVHDRPVSYLTSEADDPGLSIEHPNLRSFHIGSGTARTVLFARMDCRRFVMTLPELGNLWLKRSPRPVHYVYLFHSVNSTHTSYRPHAFDGFDTILCVGPHHVDEIRKTEEAYGLPPKELVEHGSVKLDTMLETVAGGAAAPDGGSVLVAPTWGDASIIEHQAGERLIRCLLDAGHRVVLRLHPMTVRRLPDLIARLERTFGEHSGFTLERDMNATRSWQASALMISDWSGAATEYAFAMRRPVIYVDMPQKILNPEWELIGAPSFEAEIRRHVGPVIAPAEVEGIAEVVERVLASAAVADRLAELRDRSIFNVGRSADVAAAHLAG